LLESVIVTNEVLDDVR